MAVKIINNGGPFTKTDGQRPGLYVRFIEKALASIGLGARSKVAILKHQLSGGSALADKVYRVTNMEQAKTLFGENVEDIQLIFLGGASEVVVSTLTKDESTKWTEALARLETYEFHVYVNPIDTDTALMTEVFSWVKQSRDNGKNFIAVLADEESEGNVASIKMSAGLVKDEYVVFVGGGVLQPDGTEVEADKYACYIAGLIAGTPINGSLTYRDVPFADVITRYGTADVQELLASGVLVTVVDGAQPRIEQGLTLGVGQFSKIRTVRAKQAMIDDIDKAVRDNYIGKITNNENGQVAVINAIKAYLQTLANNNVIDSKFAVELDKTQDSIGADLYVVIAVRFLDSIEYVYLAISV